jgi:hypothetical protein
MKKQSSIEWLIEEMGNKHSGAKVYFNANRELVEQAKEMEKQQIIDAYKADLNPCSDEDAEQYYTETFNK